MSKQPLYPHIPGRRKVPGLICGQCGERFTSNAELTEHLKEMHPEAWESNQPRTEPSGEGNLIELLRNEDWAALMRKGWVYLREHWPWGETLAIKNRDGRVRFLMRGELWTGRQMAELLRDTWRPEENTREYWSWEGTIADLERLP